MNSRKVFLSLSHILICGKESEAFRVRCTQATTVGLHGIIRVLKGSYTLSSSSSSLLYLGNTVLLVRQTPFCYYFIIVLSVVGVAVESV